MVLGYFWVYCKVSSKIDIFIVFCFNVFLINGGKSKGKCCVKDLGKNLFRVFNCVYLMLSKNWWFGVLL